MEKITFNFMPIITVTKPKTTQNMVDISWTGGDQQGPHYYTIYYNTTNKVSSDKYLTYGTTDKSLSKILPSSGTYYFWLGICKYECRSDISYDPISTVPVSFDFKYTGLVAPSDVTAVCSSTKDNMIELSWSSTGAHYYWIYSYYSEDSTSGYLLDTTTSTSYEIKIDNYSEAQETGRYRIKSADSKLDDSNTSEYSEVAILHYRYNNYLMPTEVTVVQSTSESNSVDIAWTQPDIKDSFIYMITYNIYYSTTNDSSKMTLLKSSIYSQSCTQELMSSGTYYFWIKGIFRIPTIPTFSHESKLSNPVSINFTYSK